MGRGRKLAVASFYVTGWIVVFLIAAFIVLSNQSPPFLGTEKIFAYVFAAAFTFSAILSAAAFIRLKKGGLRKAVAVELAVIVLFLVSVLLPSMLPPKKSNGIPAVYALRTIDSAQELYSRNYGTFANLEQLGEANCIDDTLAEATSAASAKSGNYFIMRLSGGSWCCVARPAKWGKTGERNFMITGEGIIYWNEKENGGEFVKVLGRD